MQKELLKKLLTENTFFKKQKAAEGFNKFSKWKTVSKGLDNPKNLLESI